MSGRPADDSGAWVGVSWGEGAIGFSERQDRPNQPAVVAPDPHVGATTRRLVPIHRREIPALESPPGSMLDWLTHRVHILRANGPSHRPADAKRRLKAT